MKRILRILIILCLFFCFIPTVHASTNSDSVSLTEQEIADYQIRGDQILLKVYEDEYIDSFSEGNSIYDIVSDAKTSYFLIETNTPGQRLILGKDGTVINRGYVHNAWNTIRRYALDPHLVFPEWVEVTEIYIFEGYGDGYGAAIYYVTSIGDFVLNQGEVDYTTYLYPVGAFERCTKEYKEYMEGVGQVLGAFCIRDVCNIGLYQFTGTATAFRGPIIIALTILVVVGWALTVLFFLKWRKVKKKPAILPDPDTPAA